MKKRCFVLLTILAFIFSISSVTVYATEIETSPLTVELDISDGAEEGSKTMYLYKTGETRNGKPIVEFSEVCPRSAQWTLDVIISYSKYSGLTYEFIADVYSPFVLIKEFTLTLAYGDGDYSYGTASLGAMVGDASFSASYTAYHTYNSAGTYIITIPSYTLIIHDVVTPDYVEEAKISLVYETITVT